MNTGFVAGMIFSGVAAHDGRGSDQEDRHQDQDKGNARRAVLHQRDEALIGRFMSLVVVAVGGRVSDFAVVCHCCPQWNEFLASNYRKADGRATPLVVRSHKEIAAPPAPPATAYRSFGRP